MKFCAPSMLQHMYSGSEFTSVRFHTNLVLEMTGIVLHPASFMCPQCVVVCVLYMKKHDSDACQHLERSDFILDVPPPRHDKTNKR